MEEEITKEDKNAVKTEAEEINEEVKKALEVNDSGNAKTQIYMINTLNFTKDNSGIIFGDQASLENVAFGGEFKEDISLDNGESGKECVLGRREDLSEWMAQHYNDFEMAFLLSLAVFEKTPCAWVYDGAEDLFCMMDGEKGEADCNRIRIPHQKRIETIGGREYKSYIYNHTGRVEEEFICFQRPEYAAKVLECAWNEFRFFREKLFGWLKKYISEANYSKTVKAINALAQLLRHDFHFFESKVISALLVKKDLLTDFAIAQIMIQAHGNEQYKVNVEKLFRYWVMQRKIHYSFITLMMCTSEGWPRQKVREAIENYINEVVLETETGCDNEYERQLPIFYAIGKRKAIYFKTTVEILYDKLMQYNSRSGRDKQRIIGGIFWKLILIDDMESHIDVNRKERHQDMILVKMCLIRNDVAPKVQALWQYLWKNREMHRQIKDFLEKYLYQYGGCGDEYTDYLRQFLYSFQDTQVDRDNMEYFLKKISLKNSRAVKAAEKINQRSI